MSIQQQEPLVLCSTAFQTCATCVKTAWHQILFYCILCKSDELRLDSSTSAVLVNTQLNLKKRKRKKNEEMLNFPPLTVICNRLNQKGTQKVQTFAKVNSPIFFDIQICKCKHYFRMYYRNYQNYINLESSEDYSDITYLFTQLLHLHLYCV